MATYKQIQDFVLQQTGRVMQSCWIAHVKELNGMALRTCRTTPRVKPCPPQWRPIIEDALRHFRVLQ